MSLHSTVECLVEQNCKSKKRFELDGSLMNHQKYYKE